MRRSPVRVRVRRHGSTASETVEAPVGYRLVSAGLAELDEPDAAVLEALEEAGQNMLVQTAATLARDGLLF